MSSTRQHLEDLHKTSAAHHVKMAKAHQKMAAHYSKAEGMDSAEDLADTHSTMADHHTAMSEYHLECCQTLMGKASGMGGDDGDRIVPDNVSSVLSELPANIRRVARPGQPSFGERPNVPREFEKLVSIDDDEG